MNKFRALLLLLVLFSYLNLAANDGKTTLLKGTVTNAVTGEPMTLELEFKPETGPKTKVQSTQGKFEQAFPTGAKFIVTYISKDVLREEIEIRLQEHKDAYNEQSMTFKVRKIEKGLIIKKSNFFEAGTANLTAQGKKDLEELKTTIRFNRTLEIELQIGSELHSERLAVLQQYIAGMGSYSAKISVKSDSVSNLTGGDCNITVGKVIAN